MTGRTEGVDGRPDADRREDVGEVDRAQGNFHVPVLPCTVGPSVLPRVVSAVSEGLTALREREPFTVSPT